MTHNHQPTEDEEYVPSSAIDDFAIADEDALDNPEDEGFEESEQIVNRETIEEIRAYCKKAIEGHNTFDVLNIPQNATPEDKIAVFDEMFNHKGLVHHLREIENIINTKIKEN